jgi:hypothetical protein
MDDYSDYDYGAGEDYGNYSSDYTGYRIPSDYAYGADYYKYGYEQPQLSDFSEQIEEQFPTTEYFGTNTDPEFTSDPGLLGTLKQIPKSVLDAVKGAFTTDGKTDWARVAAAAGGLYGLTQGGGSQQKQGYLGGIPTYQAIRQQVAAPALPARPGDPGRRYFSDMTYATPEKAAEAQTAAATQATGIAGLNQAAMSAVRPTPSTVEQLYGMVLNRAPDQGGLDYWKGQFGESVDPTELARFTGSNATLAEMTAPRVAKYATAPAASVTNPTAASKVIEKLPVETKAAGGIAGLKTGRYLGGPTDGMADKLPTTIDGKDPAALSHGEFVIPADVVGHLGNGNSEAGAQRLYAMMDKVRKARTGTEKQGKEINPNKYLPA